VMDYGPVSQAMVLFKCEWVENGWDQWGRPTYRHDEDGFLLANFCHLKAKDDEPFVFPSQVYWMFYFEEPTQTCWKIVLHVKPRFRCVVGENSEEIITPSDNVISLEIPLVIP
jgi:hypothetical protein